jgi:hypothetical protein
VELVQLGDSGLQRGEDEAVLPLCRELGVSYIPYLWRLTGDELETLSKL